MHHPSLFTVAVAGKNGSDNQDLTTFVTNFKSAMERGEGCVRRDWIILRQCHRHCHGHGACKQEEEDPGYLGEYDVLIILHCCILMCA